MQARIAKCLFLTSFIRCWRMQRKKAFVTSYHGTQAANHSRSMILLLSRKTLSQSISSRLATNHSRYVSVSIYLTYLEKRNLKPFPSLSGIQRQLCLYGFDRVLTGHQKGSRYHPKFVRDNYELMSEIKYCMGAKSKTMQQDLSGHKEGLKSKVLEPSPEKLSPLPDTHTTTQSPVSPIICIRNPANFTYPSSVDARVISPTMSPVNSNNEIVANPGSFWYEPDLTLLSDMQDLDDFGLFEGQAFHFIDPSMHNEVKGEKTEMKMLLPEPAVPSWSLNKMLKDVLPCTASSEELCDAWQKGFEHALSMPFDSSYWPWTTSGNDMIFPNQIFFYLTYLFSFETLKQSFRDLPTWRFIV